MSRSVRNAAALIAAALCLLGIRIAFTLTNHPSDQTLIQTALKESLEASKKGQAGGVMDLLSQELKVNDQSGPGMGQIAKFIRESRPDITLSNKQALVTGDEARIVSPINLKLELLGQSIERNIKSVTLIFHKEDARGFLFIPTTRWRLTEVRIPEEEVANLAG